MRGLGVPDGGTNVCPVTENSIYGSITVKREPEKKTQAIQVRDPRIWSAQKNLCCIVKGALTQLKICRRCRLSARPKMRPDEASLSAARCRGFCALFLTALLNLLHTESDRWR